MQSYIVNLLLVSFALTSCQISGLTSGYSHLSKKGQERVIHYKGAIDDIHDFSNIYTVTAEQVKEYLAKHDKVIIYDYTPYCMSGYCLSPLALADICKKQEANLLVISNIYDEIFHAVNDSFPILMIDTEATKTKWRGKYIEAFYYPLIGRSQKEINYALYHYFRKGTYVRSFKNYKDMDKADL